MNLKKINIKLIKENKLNPRSIDEKTIKDLKSSMKEFGYIQPIIWNKRTSNIISGHQRFNILRDEGVKEIEVIEVDLDEDKEKIALITFNKVQADWDITKLSDLFENIHNLGDDFLGLTGFTNNEITNLLSASEHIELPDLHYDGEVGQQTGIRPTMTFYFESQKDYDKAWEILKKPSGAEPDTSKLLEVIKNIKSNDVKTKAKPKSKK